MVKVTKKVLSCVAVLALKTASANVNSCCMYVMHQPKPPKEVQKLKRH